MSLFHPSLVGNQLASLRVAYYGDSSPCNISRVDMDPFTQTANTPAGDYRTLYIVYTPQNATPPTESWVPITFSAAGGIDYSRTTLYNLSIANQLLAPTTKTLQEYLGQEFDIWAMINWFWVSVYWMILWDFGHIAPVLHPSTGWFPEGSPITLPNITVPATVYPSTNNIFVNDTLFGIYSSYVQNILLQMDFTSPEFSPLTDANRLTLTDTAFLRSYSCLKRQWKGLLSGIISVFAADYAIFFVGYSFVLVVAGWVQKRRQYGLSLFDGR
jgi:hypothetical protein